MQKVVGSNPIIRFFFFFFFFYCDCVRVSGTRGRSSPEAGSRLIPGPGVS
jgi:hypothetical protein